MFCSYLFESFMSDIIKFLFSFLRLRNVERTFGLERFEGILLMLLRSCEIDCSFFVETNAWIAVDTSCNDTKFNDAFIFRFSIWFCLCKARCVDNDLKKSQSILLLLYVTPRHLKIMSKICSKHLVNLENTLFIDLSMFQYHSLTWNDCWFFELAQLSRKAENCYCSLFDEFVFEIKLFYFAKLLLCIVLKNSCHENWAWMHVWDRSATSPLAQCTLLGRIKE